MKETDRGGHHPLLDRAHVRRERIRVLPPTYVVLALIAAWMLQRLRPLPTPPPIFRLGGIVVVAAALGLMVWAILVQMGAKTSPNPWAATSRLVETGPYSWSRNPIYLADLLLQAGLSIAFWWPIGILLLPITWAALRWFVIAKEERFLRGQFGPAYDAYRLHVRRWFGRRRPG